MPFMTSLTRSIKEKKFIAFRTLARKILISMAIIGIIGLVFTYMFGIPLLSFIYQYDLSPYGYELLIIILASIISAIAIMISNFLVLLNKNKMQLVLYIVASILATIISVIFINKYKILGASISYLISYAFLLVTYLTYYELIIKKLIKK
jgi:O-antigen/teichoic acid export membrane protein